jgi:hypothetical protein
MEAPGIQLMEHAPLVPNSLWQLKTTLVRVVFVIVRVSLARHNVTQALYWEIECKTVESDNADWGDMAWTEPVPIKNGEPFWLRKYDPFLNVANST